MSLSLVKIIQACTLKDFLAATNAIELVYYVITTYLLVIGSSVRSGAASHVDSDGISCYSGAP